MSVSLSLFGGAGAQFLDNSGKVLTGGLVYSYAAGTTTPQTTYTSSSGGTPHANPIVLDSSGRVPGGEIWLTNGSSYKFVTKTSAGVTIQTLDNIVAGINSDAVSFLQAGTGAVSRTVQDKLRETVSVTDFIPSGTVTISTDCTLYFQEALDTGKNVYIPQGYYLVNDGLHCTSAGQIIYGDGKDKSIVLVNLLFNLTAKGVFWCENLQPGPQFRDLKIQFTQFDTAARGSLINYPPGIYAVSSPRFVVENCKITNAMTGINMTGNSGGSFINLLEMSAYNFGITIDGSLDTIRISQLHFWPFNLTANQTTIFQDGSVYGVYSGRCDDLQISDSLFINRGAQVRCYTSASGTTFANITNCDFDTYACLSVDGGSINVGTCFFTIGNAAIQAVSLNKGWVRITDSEFTNNVALTNAMVQTTGTFGDAYLQIDSCNFRITGDTKVIENAQTLILSDNQFVLPANASPAKTVINMSAGQINMTGNNFTLRGTGTGTALSVTNDYLHVISNNNFGGWTVVTPSTSSFTDINNNLASPEFNNSYLIGVSRTKIFTGTLSGGGVMTVAHGLGATAAQQVINAIAWYKGASGEMKQLTFSSLDGTNFVANGGTASAAYRAYIVYVNNPTTW